MGIDMMSLKQERQITYAMDYLLSSGFIRLAGGIRVYNGIKEV